jgi:hypothetical protein
MSDSAHRLVVSLHLHYREFTSRRDGMIFAMDGGLWLHRHVWKGTPMAHLVSTDRVRLLEYGHQVGLPGERLQFKPLKDPRTGIRRDAWHWDLLGRYLPQRVVVDAHLVLLVEKSSGGSDTR